MTKRIQLAIKLIVTHIALPVALIVLFFVTNIDAFLAFIMSQTILCIIYLAGYWEFFGQRFKYIFCAFIQIVMILLLFVKVTSVIIPEENLYLIIFPVIIQFFLLNEIIRILIVMFQKDVSSVEIEFPFRHGEYLITDGGNSKTSRLMNYHYYSPVHKRNKTNNSMLFATDIVKIDKGYPSFLPDENGQYPVFGMNIYSPMDGVVVKVEDNIQDNKPYSENYPYNTGNTVVIKKDNYFLLLGHLNFDSIIVRVGDHIKTNELIGRAGNSGWTERPHLHMQLIKSETDNYWMGIGVSIRYKNRNVYKNRYLKV